MSEINEPVESFASLDPSGDFGRDVAVEYYEVMARRFPDQPIDEFAESAVRLGIVKNSKLDVDARVATRALIGKLFASFPPELSSFEAEMQAADEFDISKEARRQYLIESASSDKGVLNMARWLLGQISDYDDTGRRLENIAKKACEAYELDPEKDFFDVLERCEQKIMEEKLNGQA